MEIKGEGKRGYKWASINTLVLTITAIIKISVLTRFLNKEDFGLIALVAFFLGFMNLFNDMGLTTAILHKIRISRKEYASLYWLNLAVSIFLYLILTSTSVMISEFYDEKLLKTLIPLMGVSILFSGIGRQFRTIFQKELKFKTIAIVEIIAAVFSLLTATLMAISGYGVYSLVFSALLQHLISNGFFLIFGLSQKGLLFHFQFKETKPFLKIGSYQVGSQIINYFNKDLDIIIVGKIFSPEILGGYSLAKQLVSRPAQVLNQIISNVASPTLARVQLDLIKLKNSFKDIFNGFFYITLISYLGLLIFAPLIVHIFYGDGFEDIILIVRILSIYMLIRSIGSPIGSLIIAKGKTDLEFKWNALTLVVLPFFVIIGTQYSIEWVAIAMTIGIFLLFVPGWWFMMRIILGISLVDFLEMYSFRIFYRNALNFIKKK
ncbi:MAG: MOP flippase family protein [Maribacter sp.]